MKNVSIPPDVYTGPRAPRVNVARSSECGVCCVSVCVVLCVCGGGGGGGRLSYCPRHYYYGLHRAPKIRKAYTVVCVRESKDQ